MGTKGYIPLEKAAALEGIPYQRRRKSKSGGCYGNQ
jgi:hypothetical protein